MKSKKEEVKKEEAKKAEAKKVSLTNEEKEELKGNEEGIRQVLINKAILETAKKYEFTAEEKEEFDYHFKNEKAKFFIAKEIEGRIAVNEDDVTRLYNENKAQFDAQNIPFSQAREIIQRDLLQQQLVVLEDEEVGKLIQDMTKSVEITKEEILFSKGNPDILKSIIIGKVVERKIKEADFENKEKENIQIIESNVYINYYLDLQVRKNVVVTQEEISSIYEAERGKLGNVTPNSAYSQIANGLLNNKANEERIKIINAITEEYKIEDLVKEYNK